MVQRTELEITQLEARGWSGIQKKAWKVYQLMARDRIQDQRWGDDTVVGNWAVVALGKVFPGKVSCQKCLGA